MKSVFTDKKVIPDTLALKKALGKTFKFWEELEEFAKQLYPDAICDWNYSGNKFGWSYRISDKKRVIIYLLPRQGFFKTAFVFGQKATDVILVSDVSENIKTEIKNAKVYAEGRGIRMDIKNAEEVNDQKTLIKIKINY